MDRVGGYGADKVSQDWTFGAALGFVAAWAWTFPAAGGGAWLLLSKGPWPLTNGWFALFSGLAVSPLGVRASTVPENGEAAHANGDCCGDGNDDK